MYSHPPSPICLFPVSPSLTLPLQTLRLVSLVSLIAKTKRIAERSDTNCDTHTDRQSTLDEYMIDVTEKDGLPGLGKKVPEHLVNKINRIVKLGNEFNIRAVRSRLIYSYKRTGAFLIQTTSGFSPRAIPKFYASLAPQ